MLSHEAVDGWCTVLSVSSSWLVHTQQRLLLLCELLLQCRQLLILLVDRGLLAGELVDRPGARADARESSSGGHADLVRLERRLAVTRRKGGFVTASLPALLLASSSTPPPPRTVVGLVDRPGARADARESSNAFTPRPEHELAAGLHQTSQSCVLGSGRARGRERRRSRRRSGFFS